MSTKKEIWRLLEPGVDMWQEGDEYLVSNIVVEWDKVTRDFDPVDKDHKVGRRRMTIPEPQGWISVKERMPMRWDGNSEGLVIWRLHEPSHEKLIVTAKYDAPEMEELSLFWCPLRDPEGLDDGEKAWMEHLQRFPNTKNMKWLFMAGRKSVATDGGAS